jgi:hypothetical protein
MDEDHVVPPEPNDDSKATTPRAVMRAALEVEGCGVTRLDRGQ